MCTFRRPVLCCNPFSRYHTQTDYCWLLPAPTRLPTCDHPAATYRMIHTSDASGRGTLMGITHRFSPMAANTFSQCSFSRPSPQLRQLSEQMLVVRPVANAAWGLVPSDDSRRSVSTALIRRAARYPRGSAAPDRWPAPQRSDWSSRPRGV